MFRIQNRYLLTGLLLCTALLSVTADDVALFSNLGFSRNSDVFLFGQYGIESGKPFAEIFTVDVPRNSFVANGRFSESFTVPISPGQDGRAALYTLLPEAQSVIEARNISHFAQGRMIYLLLNGQEPKATLSFRDFETGNRYNVSLIQEVREDDAAFYIDLDVEFANGIRDSFQVGRPGYFREDVASYRIKQIILSPDERSLVFVVEKREERDTGNTIRYMVETVRFR